MPKSIVELIAKEKAKRKPLLKDQLISRTDLLSLVKKCRYSEYVYSDRVSKSPVGDRLEREYKSANRALEEFQNTNKKLKALQKASETAYNAFLKYRKRMKEVFSKELNQLTNLVIIHGGTVANVKRVEKFLIACGQL